jgi:hypothetical protein
MKPKSLRPQGTHSTKCWLELAVFLACCSLLIFLPLLIIGCSTTPSGLAREATLYTTGTNIVATLQPAAQALPAPFNTAAEYLLAFASAALAAWNTWQHKQLNALTATVTANQATAVQKTGT